ncbi:MAG: T9SS type A sorting domain-containing protein [Chitinophagales bacterium]|nr:T9SS type A sorting domain-containing protein [Chitinophagales bacterium]
MKYFILLSIVAQLCSNAYPQGYSNNWVFGESAGLNFNVSPPESFESSIITFEACASISDSLGNLLFYTNGGKVWNKNNELMLNGDSLEIGQLFYEEYGSSLTQGVIIIPIPGNTYKYYIFYIAYEILPVESFGIRYAVVDMSPDDGLGKVVLKNFSIYDSLTVEKMQAVKHANGKYWWLITRQLSFNVDELIDVKFITFLITPQGIEGPYFQSYRSDSEWTAQNIGNAGEMVFSPNGDKLAYTAGPNLDIYNFDRNTGELNNVKTIYDIDSSITYGCSFSPDGSKLYVSGVENKALYQYCLDCATEIELTQSLIYQISGNYSITQMELGPDDKIYIATPYYYSWPHDVYSIKNQNLCVINNPNALGLDCDLDTNTVSLGDARVILGLPNMPNYNLCVVDGGDCDTLDVGMQELNKEEGIKIYPNPTTNTITFSTALNSGDLILISSTDGRIIKQINIQNEMSVIDVSSLSTGMYIINVLDDNSIKLTDKLFIIK